MVKPTSPLLLVGVFAVFGVGGGLVLSLLYDRTPPLPVVWTITVGVIALLVGFLAWTTRNRLRGEREARPPEPLRIAQYAALARACSPVGAGVAGAWLGALVYLLIDTGGGGVVGHDRSVSVAGLSTGAALTAAGLWLEWVCRIRVGGDPDSSRR